MLKILFLGDVIGRTGRNALRDNLPRLKEELSPDVCIVNGENAAGGLGMDIKSTNEIFKAGADIITSGNHIWKKKEIQKFLDDNQDKALRPANYPEPCSGTGLLFWQGKEGVKLAVVNIQGRVFMPDLVDCPFQAMERMLESQLKDSTHVFVDFHAEATSEKVAMGHFLDGKVTAVVGTHTHIQTSDDRILDGGTAYISDVGMCGPEDSVIGMKKEIVVEKFRTSRPASFEVSKNKPMINGVLVEAGEDGKAISIERVYLRL